MARLNWAEDFAHLHVASWYSLRYGVADPAALVARAAELGMPAIALTDRDGLYGAVKHAVACEKAGISPVLGADMALREDGRAGEGRGHPFAPGSFVHGPVPGRPLSSQAPARLRTEDAARVTLLAEGKQGWASLCRLVSAAHQAGERGAPVVTPDLVAAHGEGLVVLLGPASDAGRAIAARRPDLAAAILARWRERAEVVIEVVDHQAAGDTFRATRMLRLAREAGVRAVLTGAVRYLDPSDGPVAHVLDAVRQLVPLGQHHIRGGARAYLASGEEMARVAARVCGAPDAATDGSGSRSWPVGRLRRGGIGSGEATMAELLADTVALARRCALDPRRDLGIGSRFLPETVGEPLALLRARCEEGLDRRFPHPRGGTAYAGTAGSGTAGSGTAGSGTAGSGTAGSGTAAARRAEARRRLDHELGIIARTGLASYFLTVADVADRIRSQGIRCSIRGSGAGSLVNHLIGISGIDPVEHDLVMERFLSESRQGLPDIDLDVESARRIEAYRVIFDAYGEQRVACVSMMETYRARSAIRDVAAALGLPPHEIDAVAKAFGHIRASHIRGALSDLPELRSSGLAIPQLTGMFQIAERLDGLPRHVAMHPCGVVLSDASLLERTPVERSIEGLPLSQFDKDDVETAGMIKLDVLGVRMQSAMAHTLAEIERTRGQRVDIDTVARDDEPTFDLIRSAHTLGCFQIESPGQRELVTKLVPRDIGDLIVDISLFRPGPVNSDMVTPYLETRHGRRPPVYPHEDLTGALAETGGVVIFHEQVLRVFDAMTGCGLSEAERLRRLLADERSRQEVGEWFRGAAGRRGYDSECVGRVWQVLEAFGAFGFCKAHAAAFAVPTYQSAWLKTHYPAAFYAGVLTHDPGMYPKRVIVGDARLLGIPVLPVDVNASAGHWRVEWTGQPPREALRAGLAEVKGISEDEVARIVAGQRYISLRDFWERAGASRPVTERLVLVGAFDAIYGTGGSGTDTGGVADHADGAGARLSRRDLLARVGVLDRSARSRSRSRGRSHLRPFTGSGSANRNKSDMKVGAGREKSPGAAGGAGAGAAGGAGGEPAGQLQLDLGAAADRDGCAGLVPAGQLRELTASERVGAELEILGIDLSQHVLSFYENFIAELGVVRSGVLHRCQAGAQVLVAGVKVATQTPAIRSGQRIIFATLDDATGPVDLAFFESVQDRCAARVFGSWLLVVRGRLRRAGGSVSVNATECWDLAALAEIHTADGIRAVRAAMAAGDVPGAGGPARGRPGGHAGNPAIIYPNGFALSPYAETGSPGGAVKVPPRLLWHVSPGSSGGLTGSVAIRGATGNRGTGWRSCQGPRGRRPEGAARHRQAPACPRFAGLWRLPPESDGLAGDGRRMPFGSIGCVRAPPAVPWLGSRYGLPRCRLRKPPLRYTCLGNLWSPLTRGLT